MSGVEVKELQCRGFKQHYVEFVVYGPESDVACRLAAVAVNALVAGDGRVFFERIEYRRKGRFGCADEYRVLTSSNAEVKVGFDKASSKAWIHVSIPDEGDVDPREIAERIRDDFIEEVLRGE